MPAKKAAKNVKIPNNFFLPKKPIIDPINIETTKVFARNFVYDSFFPWGRKRE